MPGGDKEEGHYGSVLCTQSTARSPNADRARQGCWDVRLVEIASLLCLLAELKLARCCVIAEDGMHTLNI